MASGMLSEMPLDDTNEVQPSDSAIAIAHCMKQITSVVGQICYRSLVPSFCCRGSKPLLFATNAFPKCFLRTLGLVRGLDLL